MVLKKSIKEKIYRILGRKNIQFVPSFMHKSTEKMHKHQ